MKDIGAAVSDEMGAPLPMAEKLQAGAGLGHLTSMLEVLKNYDFEEQLSSAMLVREAIGVVGLITLWNWPLNQITCKVAPALAAGCTMILKPSEFTPSSAAIFAEILHEAGVPKGVFNLINGLGPEVGAAMPTISKRGYADDARKLAAINAEACALPKVGAAFEYRHAESFMGETDRRRQTHQGASDDDRSIGGVCKPGHGYTPLSVEEIGGRRLPPVSESGGACSC
jgi:hypothetical protein